MPILKFLHLPIAMKAVLLIGALGLLSIAANWFCLQRLEELNRLNAVVTRHFAPARLALAEAKAAIELFGAATYKVYSASDADQAKEAVDDMEGQYNAAKLALNNVLADYPAAAADVRRIFDKLELAHGIAADVSRAVKKGEVYQAGRIVNFKFDPARDDVTGHMDRLINILGGAQARSTEARKWPSAAPGSIARLSRSSAAARWRRCSAPSCWRNFSSPGRCGAWRRR